MKNSPQPMTTTMLSDMVQVRPRYSRSVHLARDWKKGAAEAANLYHLTPSALELLRAFAHAWERPADRAITVVGPYGAGKSAFGVFLAGLVCGGKNEIAALRAHDAALAKTLGAPKRRLLPVPVVGAREPLAGALIKSLRAAMRENEISCEEFEEQCEAALLEATPRGVADVYEIAALLAVDCGWGGLLLIADELGKFLEYAALHPRQGDIFVLQELAEAAARSAAPLFLVAVLHQNAEAYARALGGAQQAEWAKVGERFREAPFFPSDSERMDMVGLALQHDPALNLDGAFGRLAARCGSELPEPSGARFLAQARAAYPLHPLVLRALPALFRRAGQSHRSVFNFLNGQEAHALGRFLHESSFNGSAPLFTLDALFDYATETLLGGWSAGTLVRLWAEAVEATERAPDVSTDARRVLKCIALLGLLREPRLLANRETLLLALQNEVATDATSTVEFDRTPLHEARLEAALEELQTRQLVVWNRARGVFRLWEGGDIDIEAALREAHAALPAQAVLAVARDRDLFELPRLVARRHSFQCGAVRAVETVACAASELADELKNPRHLAVVLCLAQSESEAERAATFAQSESRAGVLVGVACASESLGRAARDVAACGEVAANLAELQHDRAARRELDARRFEAETAFAAAWNETFGPASTRVQWWHRGAQRHFDGTRSWRAFLSDLADATYPQTPILRNELVNRRALSSAAVAGRRALVEAMLKRGDQERLGIAAFPPEASMYESLLHATGLHRLGDEGWEWGAPQNEALKLGPVWRAMEAWVFAEPAGPRPLKELWDLLAAPPFGLLEGVMPPLLCAFLLAHARETTLYREGTFLPEPGIADWEVLLRRPDLFAVAGSRADARRDAVLQQLARDLGLEKKDAALVPVVRGLLKTARALPPCAWNTKTLSPATREVREALEKARSPEALLWHDIPRALGLASPRDLALFDDRDSSTDVSSDELSSEAFSGDEFSSDEFCAALREALREWSAFAPGVLQSARDELLNANENRVRSNSTVLCFHYVQANFTFRG